MQKLHRECGMCGGFGKVCIRCGESPKACVCFPEIDEEKGKCYIPARKDCPCCGGWGFIDIVD